MRLCRRNRCARPRRRFPTRALTPSTTCCPRLARSLAAVVGGATSWRASAEEGRNHPELAPLLGLFRCWLTPCVATLSNVFCTPNAHARERLGPVAQGPARRRRERAARLSTVRRRRHGAAGHLRQRWQGGPSETRCSCPWLKRTWQCKKAARPGAGGRHDSWARRRIRSRRSSGRRPRAEAGEGLSQSAGRKASAGRARRSTTKGRVAGAGSCPKKWSSCASTTHAASP
jgi:hypothetical protein